MPIDSDEAKKKSEPVGVDAASSKITANSETVALTRSAFDSPARATPKPSLHEIHHEVFALAWPSVTSMLLQTANSLMDVFFVGHLPNSSHALAATGVGGGIVFLLISISLGISVGTTALVARFTGAHDSVSRVEVVGQSLMLSTIIGLVFGLIVYLFRWQIVGLMLDVHKNAESVSLCVQFLSIVLLAAAPLFLLNVQMGAFRGIGDTRTPLLITAMTVLVHISLNSVLIYGRLGFPRMGVSGAGLALSISILVGVVLYFVAMNKHESFSLSLHSRFLRMDIIWIKRILKIGIPASIQAVIRTLGMMSFSGMLAHTVEGDAGVAALQIGIRAEAIAFMPGFGYSVAAAALVGQSLGANDPSRAERCGWAANWQAIAFMTLMAGLFYTLSDWFSHLFTSDPMVSRLSADYLRISALSEPFLALGMVLTGALQGAGDTLRPTYITFFTMWIVRIPLSWLLMFGMHMNTHGAWVAMNITTVLGGLLTAALFHSGRWKRVKI